MQMFDICRDYRLPSDILQTAKVTKLLISLESGQNQILAGKTLDDIQVDVNEEIIDDNDDTDSDSSEDINGSNLSQNPHHTVSVTGSYDAHLSHSEDVDDSHLSRTQHHMVSVTGPHDSHPLQSQHHRVTVTWSHDSHLSQRQQNSSKTHQATCEESCIVRPSSRRKCVHKPWSADERSAVHSSLLGSFCEGVVPGKALIDSCIESNPCLAGRS